MYFFGVSCYFSSLISDLICLGPLCFKFCWSYLSFQRTSSWIHWSFVSFLKTLFGLFLLWSLLFPSFYSLWALFVLYQVPLSVKLDCLFELFLELGLVMLWISLLGLLSQCPTDFWLYCSRFHFFQGIFWFLPWSHCCSIHCLVICCLVSMSLCIFSVLLVIDFKFHSVIVREDAWYDSTFLEFIKTCLVF